MRRPVAWSGSRPVSSLLESPGATRGLLVVWTLAWVAALLVYDRRGALRRARIAKVAASLGFVAAGGLAAAGLDGPAGGALVAAVVACLVGDGLLSYPGRRAFLAGTAAFLVGHVGYAVAFWAAPAPSPAPPGAVAGAGGAVLAMGALALVRVAPRVDRGLFVATAAYVLVIATMVAAAVRLGPSRPLVAAGAVAFALSDLSVAEDRLVAPSFLHRAWGLPLYYAAQLAIAFGMGAVR